MSERVLQQSIIAFELLGQFLLSISGRGKSIDGCCLFRIAGCVITQSTARFTQIAQLLNEGVIVAQHAGARAEDIPVQRNLHQRETVESFGCAIIPFRIGVDCTERQPGEQHQKNQHRRRGERQFHGRAAVKGVPR
jgi:hypothetical protein